MAHDPQPPSDSTTAPVLEARGLVFRYANGRGVNGLDLSLRRGDILGLLGLNGAGKSTTLRLLSGSLRPAAGEVRIDGIAARAEPARARRRMGYLPERPPLYRELTVDEQLALAGRLHGLSGRPLAAACAREIERCGLGDCRRRLVGALSQGYRQRLGIAQCLLHDPAVLLLDEPTVGLDPAQIHALRALVRALGAQRAVVLSSHVLPEVEATCTRVAVLHQGCLVHQQPVGGGSEGRRLRVRLKRPPETAELAALPGVAEVTQDGPQSFLLRLKREEATDALVQRAAAGDWGLVELAPHADPLEDLFLHLTRGDAEEPAA